MSASADAAALTGGDWPRTTRLTPWLVAAFMAMLFLVPFDSVLLPVGGPIDLKLDRIVLAGAGALWLTCYLTGGTLRPRFRRTAIDWAILAVVGTAVAGLLVNAETLANLGELELAIKKLSLLLSYVAVFYLTTTVVRPSEVPGFCAFLVGLAAISALGVVLEYRTGFNVFYEAAGTVLPGPFQVMPPPADPMLGTGRPAITGPTTIGIATAVMLGLVLPFAVLGMMRSRGRRFAAYAFGAALIVAGAVSTQKKTGLVVPAAAMVAMVACRPRLMVRLIPLGLVLLVLIQVLAPGAAVGVKAQFAAGNFQRSDSTTGRTADYDATLPDILANPALGRGHGTYEPDKYRFLDNEYLHRVLEQGFLGLAAYIALIVSVGLIAVRAARASGQGPPPIALAAVGAVGAYAAASAVFDALSFPQAPYAFMVVAAIAVVAASGSGAHKNTASLDVRPA